MPTTRPISIVALTATYLALALACGSGDEPEPADDPVGTPSLGELLGAGPAEETPTPALPELDPVLDTPAPLPDLGMPVAEEPEVVETEECTRARQALSTQREAVDARRVREIESAERSLANGQLAMQNCLKTSPCNEDAKLMGAAQEKEKAGESAYQNAMQRVARYEAGLFEYEQAVDRACGRR